MSSWVKEASMDNACHAEGNMLVLMELPFALEENIGLFAAAFMGHLTSSNRLDLKLVLKNVVAFFSS